MAPAQAHTRPVCCSALASYVRARAHVRGTCSSSHPHALAALSIGVWCACLTYVGTSKASHVCRRPHPHPVGRRQRRLHRVGRGSAGCAAHGGLPCPTGCGAPVETSAYHASVLPPHGRPHGLGPRHRQHDASVGKVRARVPSPPTGSRAWRTKEQRAGGGSATDRQRERSMNQWHDTP